VRDRAPRAERRVPLFDLKRQEPGVRDRIEARMDEVLRHCQFVLGPEVVELEQALAAFCGARHAIGVSAGRDALTMALMALGAGHGDAVFVPAFTFSATAGAVAAVGATPVFVDVDAATFNIDPDDLERVAGRVAAAGKLTPKAVMPVDLYGLPADYAAVAKVAERYSMTVIADAAQSFGARSGGRWVGTLAPITATSFYPTKPLGGYGDGGALFADDDALADEVRLIRTHGRLGSGDEALRLGMTGRLDTLQAAVLLVKLEGFAEELAARRHIAALYSEALAGDVMTPTVPPGYDSAWALYTVRVAERDRVRARLDAAGVGTGLFYAIPLHRHAAFKPWINGGEALPVSEQLAGEVLSLPIYGALSDEDVAFVVGQLKAAL
jgi:dTDP-4-amino-4,6-dideoxygalactose transaminase